MHESNEMTPLGFKILAHWNLHRPKMVASLVRENRLQQAVFTAQELMTDLLHEMAVVKKMDYQIDWEMATMEWAFLLDLPAHLSPATNP